MASPASAKSKKPQPIPWTHQETVQLIRAYEEKWYSLKRGPIKSSQWEEVAVTVAARCGYDYTEPSKSAIQCRHKMEKLRQRFRAENHRLGLSPWPYFDLMDRLERGPLPISARPMIALPYQHLHGPDPEVENDDDDDDDDETPTKSRSMDYILRRPPMGNRFGGDGKLGNGVSRVWDDDDEPVAKRPRPRPREVVEEEDCEDVKVEFLERRREREVVLELAAQIRAFSESFVGMENMKMEIIRDTERCRREMESKRIDMILRSQNKIVDSITRAFRFEDI